MNSLKEKAAAQGMTLEAWLLRELNQHKTILATARANREHRGQLGRAIAKTELCKVTSYSNIGRKWVKDAVWIPQRLLEIKEMER